MAKTIARSAVFTNTRTCDAEIQVELAEVFISRYGFPTSHNICSTAYHRSDDACSSCLHHVPAKIIEIKKSIRARS